MATTYTSNAKIARFAFDDTNWHLPVIAAMNTIDALTPIGGLCVTLAQVPSSTLNVSVSAGDYRKADGTIGTFAGNAAYAVLASSTRNLWLTDAGTLTAGASWPATPHIRLATVVTGTTTITGIADARLAGVVSGPGSNAGSLSKTGDTATGNYTFSTLATGTPMFTIDAVTRKLGFFDATPQTQATALSAMTAAAGTPSDSIADVSASHNQSILNNNFASLTVKMNGVIAALKRHGLMGV